MNISDLSRDQLVQLVELVATEVYAKVKELQERSSVCKVILVQPMDEARFSSEVLKELHSKGIMVIPVTRRVIEASDDSLGEAILKQLKVLEHLHMSAQSTNAPNVDEEAARIVDEAMENMPPSDPATRQKFLDDFYGGHD